MREEVLSNLKITLNCEEKFNLNKATSLHMVTMESLNSMYARVTGRKNWKPYSQSLRKEEDKIIWDIKVVSNEAYKDIIIPLLDKNFNIQSEDVYVEDMKLNSISKEDIYSECHGEDVARIFKIEFETPTAFRIDGKNHNFPDIKSIYRNLIRRYEAISEAEKELNNKYNKELLDELVSNTNIIAYDLKSTSYVVRGIRIPSFVGNITIKVNGEKKILNMARWLLSFGEYSGVGINTSKGMGSIKVTDGKKR